MPTTKAAAKAYRQNIKAYARNKAVKDNLKKLSVSLRKAITAKQTDKAAEAAKALIRALDKAAQKKIVTRNTASRKKSRALAAVKRLKS